MKKETYIEDIIEYFKELKGLWQSKHRETIDEKIHSSTRNFSTINIILTFLLISLTIASIFLTGLNSTSHEVSDLANTLTGINIPNATEDFNSSLTNFTIAQIEFKSTNIQATYGMMKIILYIFGFALVLLFLFNLLSAFTEHGYHKRIKKWDEDLITFEEIITFLYSLKIKFGEHLKEGEIRKKLFLFNKLDFIYYRNSLSQILGKLEGEGNDKNKSKD
ncbi:MAG: hypothetical protein ABIH28_00460 [archaeon]